MPNLEWSVAQTIKSDFGTVDLNTVFYPPGGATNGWLYLVHNQNDYSVVPGKFRPVVDSRSQADGSSIQPPYIDGMLASMTIGYWVCPNGNRDMQQPACDEDLRLMDQYLMGVLNGLRNYPQDVSTQQYAWQPSGLAYVRLLEGVMLATWPTPDFTTSGDQGGILVLRKLALQSPYPYALDNNQVTTDISASSTAIVTNGGNIEQLPVLQIHGPSSGVTVENAASGLSLTYDDTLPGAMTIPSGHFVEVTFAEGTALLDGDPTMDYIAGLDPAATDLWPLLPNSPAAPGGEQEIIVGGGADITLVSFWAWV